ncbi:MAG: hypothetical protein PGN34_04555 [Methylobacterium frigidaeris]
MPRPREAVADAIRTARIIVMEEGTALASAASGHDQTALDAACRNLTTRIAQAILDAERETSERAAIAYDDETAGHIAPGVRFVT